MLFLIPTLKTHKAYRLNKHVRYFFRKLIGVTNVSNFNPISNYFHPEFVTWLNRADQVTLKGHFENFFEAFKILPPAQKGLMITRFTDSQAIEQILDNIAINGNLLKVNSIPISIRPLTKTLFKYLYETTLSSFGNIKDHYKQIYGKLISKTCPFCGIEKLNPPSLRKQDYDHILHQSKYLYTSVNLDNLVPMGTECNRNYKGITDVIYKGGARVSYYSPFHISYNITLSLIGSIPPNNIDDNGTWNIDISPNNLQTQSWDRVFKIKRRYVEQMLNGYYKDWLNEFRSYCKVNGIPVDNNQLRLKFGELGGILLGTPLSDPNLIKGSFFQFLSTYTDPGHNSAVLAFVSS
jgi:hypothetical protein